MVASSLDHSGKQRRIARDSQSYSCKEFQKYFGKAWKWYWDEALIATSTDEAMCAQCGEIRTSCVDACAQWSKATYCRGDVINMECIYIHIYKIRIYRLTAIVNSYKAYF